MVRRLKKPGFRGPLLATLSFALAFILGVLYLLISRQVSDVLLERLEGSGHAKPRDMAHTLSRKEQDGQWPMASGALLKEERGFTYVAIVSGSGEVLLKLKDGRLPAQLEQWLTQLSQSEAPSTLTLELLNGNLLLSEVVQPSLAGPVSYRAVVVDFSSLAQVQQGPHDSYTLKLRKPRRHFGSSVATRA